ncbi:MAG: glycosyltransferase [Candidatus Omnitrophica bacterium]|nr:glycosyltransferase [Candidatus Omnitrophota bacterium]
MTSVSDEQMKLVLIPACNERDNIRLLLEKVLSTREDLNVLVVDDSSTDGTTEIIRGISERESRVEMIQREGPRGMGYAIKDGLEYALDKGVRFVIVMDADLSHDPVYIPEMIEALSGHDLVVGSRFVPGGCDERRSLVRMLISRLARNIINGLLRTGVEDPTSGYKCFTGSILAKIEPYTLRSENHFICTETLYRAIRKGARVSEVPIRFHPRSGNLSKLTVGIVFDCFFKVIMLAIRKW